ncbi:MAG: hypothetical protein ACE5Q6_18820 [Dehalococcoidia bacterium]
MRLAQAGDWVQPALIFAGRIVMGVLLSVVLSVIGVGIAWGAYVFSGAVSQVTLLVLFMIGAGTGAGVGSFLAWLRIDRLPRRSLLLVVVLVLAVAGIAGAWGGYEYGSNQEVACCVGPSITPITYIALGATLGTNVLALAMGIAQDIKARGGWTKFRTGVTGSAIGASSGARDLPR